MELQRNAFIITVYMYVALYKFTFTFFSAVLFKKK